MAKKHTRNQSTNLSASSFTSKESKQTEKSTCHQIELKTSRHSCATSNSGTSNSTSSTSSVGQQSSNPFQVTITRLEDHKDSFSYSGQVFPDNTTVTFTSNDPVCQYHYYQTNSNRWVHQNDYKQQTINYWLENVIKNNQAVQQKNEDFDKEYSSCDVREIDDVIINADDSAFSLQRPKQRYKPYSACAKRELPLVDQSESSYRQDKIRTLKALIAKHDEHINEVKLCTNMEIDFPKENAEKIPLQAPEKGRNVSAQPSPAKPKHGNCRAIKEKKSPAFDIRNPNSIFFAVLEEEQFWHEQHSKQMPPMARRKRGRSAHTEHSWNRCCATETFSEQHDEFIPHVELGNISAS